MLHSLYHRVCTVSTLLLPYIRKDKRRGAYNQTKSIRRWKVRRVVDIYSGGVTWCSARLTKLSSLSLSFLFAVFRSIRCSFLENNNKRKKEEGGWGGEILPRKREKKKREKELRVVIYGREDAEAVVEAVMGEMANCFTRDECQFKRVKLKKDQKWRENRRRSGMSVYMPTARISNDADAREYV